MAKLLCDRPGEWFEFYQDDYGRKAKKECIPTALIVKVSEEYITDISRNLYRIDSATRERLMSVLGKYEPVSVPE
ncbi:hypothetical protein [Erwinia amylovora]|uniref:hypothetical protein n=1 Tax=Erwinia amylovora TaxID=552 RepID=UPI0020BFA2F9|nr:hypothetical protein [Erwinia amylovora]MCK8417622.1 hypothetical protein [Erwinia amylovora]